MKMAKTKWRHIWLLPHTKKPVHFHISVFFSFLFLIFLTLISSFWIVILPFFVQFFCSILFMFDVVTIWSTWWAVVYSLMRILRVPSETGSVLFDINDDFFPFHDCYCVSLFFFKKWLSFCHQCECVCPFACKWVRVRLRRIYFFVVLVLFPPPSVWPVTPAVLPMRHIALDRKLDLFVRLFFFLIIKTKNN